MKSIIMFAILFIGISRYSIAQEEYFMPANKWQIGIGLGELPMGGSFKPSITIGYHFSDKIYTGIIYQFKDRISRDNSSFNAKSTELAGLVNSTEEVGQRFLFQLRYKPIKYGPYLSTGFVFNDEDTESMLFDSRDRSIAGESYSESIAIWQTRPAGWGFAIGIGYQFDFKNGFSANAEWTPAWLQYPVPDYGFAGEAELSDEAKSELQQRMDDGFNSSVTNMYKVFHIGIAYNFK